jgi:NhaP-type Na+/H+ and K+/H+ antiporter
MVAELSNHGSVGLLVVGGVFLAYAVISRRLATTVVSGPMVFVALGVLVGSQGLDLVDFSSWLRPMPRWARQSSRTRGCRPGSDKV